MEYFKKYRIERKSNVDVAIEKVTNNIMCQIADMCGMNDMYHLGCVSMLHMLINNFDQEHPYNKECLLAYLSEYPKQIDGCSDDIKKLIEEYLKEFDDEE